VDGSDVIVVGAGPNGLSAAVALALEGYRVHVHEAAKVPGGGTRTEERTLPGFRHDVCSTVHPMGAASPWLRALGLERHGLAWVHPDVALAHPFDDGSAAILDRDPKTTAASLDAGDRDAYLRLVDPMLPGWEDLLRDVLAPPIHVPRRPLALARFSLAGLRSAESLVRARFSGDRARALLAGIAGHALLPLDASPSAAFALALVLCAHTSGWPFAAGGSDAIARALGAVLGHAGGRIATESEVETIDAFDGAGAVLLDLTSAQVLRVAGRHLPRRYRRSLARFRYGPGAFKIDWALREPIPWTADACRRAGTVHLAGTFDEIARSSRAAYAGAADRAPTVILTQPSLFDPRRAPPGMHVAWAYCRAPHGSAEGRAAAVERQIERFAPGFRDVVLTRVTMTARDLETHDANLVGGDIAGGLQVLRQILARPALRLDPYATPLLGLYVCSASTPPGGAVHGMCGYHAARSAERHLARGRVLRLRRG
jgi:phytoene dehydrogenase-like protein